MTFVPPVEPIAPALIETICSRLSRDKQVRFKLPLAGRLHIDRQLPFLCVFRHPARQPDPSTERLVTGEAAYLISSGDRRLKESQATLVRSIVETLSQEFNAFLLIELWAAKKRQSDLGSDGPARPAFRIVTSQARPPTTTIEALEKALKRIKIQRQPARVEVVYQTKRSPAGMSPLLPAREARRLNCYIIGLEVEPIYRQPANDELYPVLLNSLHRGLARALKRAFFEFSGTQTSHRPANYQALGRRAMVKAVWEVDRRLAEISNAFDFLLQVTPVNTDQAWTAFKRGHFERLPLLHYRPLPVDPALLKRQLYAIHLERVEDPTLAFLFREKRAELDRQISMLEDRGSRRFLYGSLQLFGGVNPELLALAETILAKISPRSRENSRGNRLDAQTFAERARAEIDYYRQFYPELSARVQVREDTVGLMVSQGNLLVGKQSKIPAARVEALLQHEVGTHVLTYFNGRCQPFQQLYTGLAGYEELQEGLAVLAEYLVGGLSRPRLRLLAGRVVAAHHLIDGASFIDTFRALNHTYGFKQRTAFTIAGRIYRGGGLTKDAVYLRGLVSLLKYLKNGGELEPLFVGKIAADHIRIIQELQWRQVLRSPPLRPRYMENPATADKLGRLQDGLSVLELIERKKR